MKCPSCNKNIEEDSSFCTNCGKRLERKDVKINTNAYYDDIDEDDMLIESILWCTLGFFAPIIGLILYYSWKRNKPKKSKALLIGALVKLISALVIMIFLVAYTYFKKHQ